jgi:hypothetical protein
MTLLEAIAREEGFYVAGSRPQRNNNPGDLEYGPETIRFGATAGDPRFAVFADARTGWNALRSWLSVRAKFDANGNLVGGYIGATIEQAINRFAPPSENDSAGYVGNVCVWTGLQPADTLTIDLLILPEGV